MEIGITIISFVLLMGLFISPILLIWKLNKMNVKFKFFTYMIIAIAITASITFTFAWWVYESDKILLTHYGYDMDGMNENEFYGHVLPENLGRVKSLEISIMGIGWPLKAMMTYVFYVPYLFIVYIASRFAGRLNKNNN